MLNFLKIFNKSGQNNQTSNQGNSNVNIHQSVSVPKNALHQKNASQNGVENSLTYKNLPPLSLLDKGLEQKKIWQSTTMQVLSDGQVVKTKIPVYTGNPFKV